MKSLNYERLHNITRVDTPYRGSTNRYPIGNRRHNKKYFLVQDENGSQVFDIVYGIRWKRYVLTKEEYERLQAKGAKLLQRYQQSNQVGTDDWIYTWHDSTPNILGRVRPDNSFEFTARDISQGERSALNNWCSGWFYNDSRRGGVIYKDIPSWHILPIFKGLRVDCSTMKPITQYQVIGRNVQRKIGASVLDGYTHFYSVSEVMFKAMDWNTFINLAVELVKDALPELKINDGITPEVLISRAHQCKDESPIDAAILYMIAYDIGRMQWNVRTRMVYGANNSFDDSTPEELFFHLKRILNKKIYKNHAEVFKETAYGVGEVYPSSEWGVAVIVDGEKVEQYGYAA